MRQKPGVRLVHDAQGEANAQAPAPGRLQSGESFSPLRPSKPTTIKHALRLQAGAEWKREIGRDMLANGDAISIVDGRFALAEADSMEKAAAEFMDIGSHVTGPQSIGNGGELIVRTQEAVGSVPGIVDTLRESPGMLAATASRERLELTGNAMPLAVDLAESIKPQNNLEKMLAHQLAAAHRLAMLLVNQSAKLVDRHDSLGPINQAHSVEACRLANAAGRAMSTFQDGMLTLDRIRRGGRQVVTVQHVNVEPGGQAVVAGGSVKAGRRGPRTRGTGRK